MSDPTHAAKTGAEAARAAHDADSKGVSLTEAHDGEDSGATTASSWKRARQKLGSATTGVGGKVADIKDRTMSAAVAATASDEPVEPAGAAGSVTRRTRKARLRLSRLDPWSVMKTMLLFSVAGGIIFFVATWVVWGVINASGVFDSINKAVTDLVASPSSETNFRLEDYVNTGRVLGFAAVVSAINAVLLTALATLFAFLYNLAATVLGGLEVTLAED